MKNKDYAQVFIIVISLVVSIIEIKNEFFRNLVSIIIAAALVIFIALLIYKKVKANKNLSNTAVIAKSQKYTKMFIKLLKANEKALNKYINVRGFKRLEKLNRQVVKKINHITDVNSEKAIILKNKLNNEYENYYNNKRLKHRRLLLKSVQCCSEQQAYEIYKVVQKNISSLRRILLQLEQHEKRIKLGEFVVKYSLDIKEQIESYLDDIGWTYVLLGDNKKGLEAVRMGLNLIDYKLDNLVPGYAKKYDPESKENIEINLSEKDEILYYDLLLLKARALRHLGTTYYTYKTEKDEVRKHLSSALNIVYEEEFKKFYLEYQGEQSIKAKRRKTYCGMTNGLEFNMMLYEYNCCMKHKDVDAYKLEDMYGKVCKMIDEIKADGLKDRHRFVKLKSFKCQLYTAINDLKFKNENPSTVAEDLKDIETLLNDNIYFDEAIEVYLYEKIEKAYDDTYAILNK